MTWACGVTGERILWLPGRTEVALPRPSDSGLPRRSVACIGRLSELRFDMRRRRVAGPRYPERADGLFVRPELLPHSLEPPEEEVDPEESAQATAQAAARAKLVAKGNGMSSPV